MSLIKGLFNVCKVHNDREPSIEQGMRLLFYCPGCKEPHGILVGGGTDGPRWTWNGDCERPVLGPSILVTSHRSVPPVTMENLDEWKRAPWEQKRIAYVCHSFVGCNGAAPGEIIYLGDCTHDLANKVVPIPPYTRSKETL